MVTQEQLAALRAELESQIGALRGQIQGLQTENASQIGALRGQIQGLQTENQTLRTQVARLMLKGL
jgi:hypothetical protein